MKKISLLMAFCFLVFGGTAQNQFNCSSHEHYSERMKNDPVFKKNQEQLEKETEALAKNQNKPAAAPPYIIPVVFHVIHTTGAGNISDAQIVDQINILNQEFNRLQPDAALTPPAFQPIASAFQVEFRLATIDPNGNCTNGINRIYSTLSNCSFEEDDVKALSYWPSNSYLNIWIVQSMHYSGSMNCDGGGYATFPGGPATLDGINIRGDLISNIGTAASNTLWGNFKGRYLIHELGHWFNLRHIWGDANCGNDLVADTPPAVGPNSGCPSFPHNAFNSCAGSNANGEMVTNYMDYTNGPCLNLFTAGQVTRMTAAINSPVSGRNNLWSNSNLALTGTSNPYTYPPVGCVSTPLLLPYGPVITCVGDSVNFVDYSYGGVATSRQWTFPGGNASSLTDSIVKVAYASPGVYNVELTTDYLSSTKTTTYTNKVYVLDGNANPNYSFPFSDSFEDWFNFGLDWIIVDRDNDLRTWEILNTTSYTGSNCVGLLNFLESAPLTDDLISPAYDLTAAQNPTLTFRLNFTGRINANYDRLQVFISNNCGKTWNSFYQKNATSGGGLKTVAANATAFNTPGIATNEWRLEKANIPNSWANGIVRFKFSFTSGGGNNIYLDDINIDGFNTTSLDNQFFTGGISLFPNPADNEFNLKYTLKDKAPVELQVTDVMGKVCFSGPADQSNEGENTTVVNTRSLNNGVYFIRMMQNNATIYTTKFVKQSAE